MKPLFLFFILIVFSGLFAGEQLPLAKDGKTDYKIVWPERENLAADELKVHLDKITGAAFPLVKDCKDVKRPAIYLGATAFAGKQKLDFSKFWNFGRSSEDAPLKWSNSGAGKNFRKAT